ncbi:MAG: hypothetical protein LBL17_00510 [Coxiellaceae bacterium]|jgi:hypothetical protein|nr:hypothetical protein [Coxiellaceae bacterium]
MPLSDLLKEVMKMKADGKKVRLLSDEEETNYNSGNSNTRKNRSTGVSPCQ